MISSIRATVAGGFSTCPADDVGSTPALSPLPIASAQRIARLTSHFMHAQSPSVGSRMQLRLGVSQMLEKKGWLYGSGHVKQHLWRDFKEHVGENALAQLGCAVKKLKTSWIHDIIGAHTVGHHPLRYLLLFDFLGLGPGDFHGFPPIVTETEIEAFAEVRMLARPRVKIEEPSPKLIAHYRKGILAEIRHGLTRADIQKKYSRRFRVMIAFDRQWLDYRLPPLASAPRGTKDNSAEDAALVPVIAAAVLRLQAMGEHLPNRITLHAIALEAALASFQNRKDLFPKSCAVAEAACQTIEQHRVAVLHWAAERYRAEGENPNFKIFAKRAAFKPERFPQLRALARQIHESIAVTAVPRP